MKTSLICHILAVFLVFQVSGQQLTAPFPNSGGVPTANNVSSAIWKSVKESNIPNTGTRYILPTEYITVQLNETALLSVLNSAPKEFTPDAQTRKVTIDLPLPDGSMETFLFVNSPIMEEPLQRMYPNIRTFGGVSTTDPTKRVRFDFTPQGFHAMILINGKSTVFIDPYSFGGGDTEHYIVYERQHYASSVVKSIDCAFTSVTGNPPLDPNPLSYNTCELRQYRLALAATGEYTQFHGGTVAAALAAQVTTMNRVNGVYERDFSVRMNIIGNNNLLIFTNGATDPYTNNNGGAMLGQNQTEVDNTIGSANYDIGHVFSTGGGGIAGLGVVCFGGNKARGVTGSPAPVGDPFDIDYVCHEIGHQFGANHTQNNNCQRNNATAMEPGSASTIMGYAGICPPNVQNNSDDHFHGVSMQEVGAFLNGTSCASTSPLSNSAPTITGTNGNVTVPANTPFSLTATATDPDGDIISYNWEQMDNQISTQPPVSTSTGGPNFRSFSSSTNPTRYFPNLTDLANGGPFTWEVLPSVTRTMNFRVTARDNAAGGGCTDYIDVSVNVDGNTGPFVVTYPSATGIVWNGLSNETVTWNVAGTNGGAVACANVDILLSTDGGQTYPTVLASNVPNDGSETIVVPNTPTTTARVMVVCSNGTFFDISDNNFEIAAATFDYTLTTANNTASVCTPNDAIYTIDIGEIGGYSDPVNLSVSGLPAGATFNFSTNPVTPIGSSTLTISNTGAVTPGSYTFNVDATSTSGPKTLVLNLNINNGSPAAITLTSPANGATGVSANTTFTWTASPEFGATYEIDIATDAGFSSIVDQATGLGTNSYTSGALSATTTYYWRVRVVTGCGTSPWSSTFDFTTSDCSIYTSTDVPVVIPTSGTPTVTSTLNVPATGTIQDVNVTSLIGTHSWINDLTVTLTSPSGTVVTLWDQICADENDFDVAFDDAATPGALPCPPTGGGTYQPANPLSAFNGESANGTWTLTIADNANQDGGSLTDWSLEICITPPAGDDAGISAIIEPTAQICDNPFIPEVTITNFGTSNLTSATINYQIDAGPVQTQNWTGNLAPGANENVILAPITSPTVGSPITFTVYTTLPNGSVDPVTANDTSEIVLTILPQAAFPYAQDFETAGMPAELLILNPNADAIVWDHSNTVSANGVGTGSAFIDNYNTNATGTLDWIILPVLDLTNSTNTILTFDVAYAPYDATLNDTLIVAVNDDCGTLYTPEYFEGGTDLGTTGGFETNAFTPTAAQWRNDTVDLSAYDGLSNVRVAFINLSGWGNFLWLDNINIETDNQIATGTDTQTACDSLTWIDGNTYYASNNTATHLIPGGAASGADSLVTLDLTILNSTTATDVQTACGSYTWIDGNTYNTSNNTATHIIPNAVGCDSIITLDLTINNATTATDVQTACGPYLWIDGNTYNTSNNTATHIIPNAAGCDSIITLDLTINSSTTATDVQTACGSYLWIDGNTYNTSNNTATYIIPNAAGCDSIITLDLTINNATTATDVQTACGSYLWIDGNTYNTSNNTATHTIPNAAGCDSIITLDLTINNATTATDVQTACGSYLWIDGNTYNTSNNTATHIIPNAAGCDSIITLDLTINNATTATDVQVACGSYLWIDGNTYNTSNNTATHIIPNAAGCDSIITLDLTISTSVSGTDVQTSCGPFLWIDGNTYNTSNNSATHTLTGASVNGCDSIVTLNLTVNSPTASTDVQTACGSYLWIDGNTYNTSNNTATHIIPNAAGCDSVITLDLTINSATTGTDVVTACETYLWIDGNTYNSSNNTATFTTTNAAGCDSIITLDLTILDNGLGIDTQISCGPYTWIDGITYTSSNTTATYMIAGGAANGCDSMVTLNLTIPTLNNGVTQLDYNLIEANSSTGTYQWIDCDNNNTPIPGATSQQFTATANGNYAVIVSEGPCSDTSSCVTINTIGIDELEESVFTLYPNPTDDQLTVELSDLKNHDYTLYDATGRVVMRGSVQGGTNQISIGHLARGTYTFELAGYSNVRSVVKL